MSISTSCHQRQRKSMGRTGGSCPTQGNSWGTKTPAGAEVSNKLLSVFLFANLTWLQRWRPTKLWRRQQASQEELRSDCNLHLEDKAGLRSQCFHTLFPDSRVPHISKPFNKQIQLPIKHVAVSKCSGFSAQRSHYSAVTVKGSDIWCENYILTRCHVCLKFLFITL